MAQEIPVVYHHYEVLRRPDGQLWMLGRGGMGVTYKALDTRLRTHVALKIIHEDQVKNEVIYRYFLREAHAAAALSHPNIPQVYYLSSEQHNCFYAMEFIDGETVEHLVNRRTCLPEREALSIVVQVARALEAARKVGLVHRDIKPPNIMLVEGEGERHVKLIDFGLAKSYVREAGRTFLYSQSFGFAGTPQFASPEQFDEQPLDCRSDIYSLGVTLWYMLAGQPPFRGNAYALIDSHRTKPPPYEKLPTDLSGGTRALLDRMLAKDPEARFQTPEALRQEAEACVLTVRDEPAAEPADSSEALAAETLVELPIAARPSVPAAVFKPEAPPAPKPPVAPTPAPPAPVSKPVVPPPEPVAKPVSKPAAPPPPPVQKSVPAPAPAPKVIPAQPAKPAAPPSPSPTINKPPVPVPTPPPTPIKRGANFALLAGGAGALLAAVAAIVWLRWPQPQPVPPGGGTSTPALVPTPTPAVADNTPPPPPPPSTPVPRRAAALGNVTRERPYVNLRGMEFVPLPAGRTLMGVTPVRRQDYAAFAEATALGQREWETAEVDGVPVGRGNDEPAVSVGWEDARAFCAWLSRVDSEAQGLALTYRLPTVAEWVAARGSGTYPWGEQWPPPRGAGNYGDAAAEEAFRGRKRHLTSSIPGGYRDGFATTSPVKAFPPNALGLYDIGGNVKQWCLDPNKPGEWVYMGSSWYDVDQLSLKAKTSGTELPGRPRVPVVGFRCVLDPKQN